MFESDCGTVAPPYETWERPMSAPYVDANGSLDARGTLDRLLATQPGPDVLVVAASLSSFEDCLSATERLDLAIVLERCSAWVEAIKLPVFAGISRDGGAPSSRSDEPGRCEDTRLEVGLALRWSEWMVDDRMRTAAEIDEQLPSTWQALAGGRVRY